MDAQNGPSSLDEKEGQKGTSEFIDDDPDASLSEDERAAIDRALVWKLDKKLLPWLCVLYLAAFLDRTNIGNAKIEGLTDDLHITNGQYNATLSIFFVSYAVFEPLSNVLLKRFQPRYYISGIILLWGITMTFMGFTFNFGGMMAARWWLGVFEAGLFPGVNYYFSCWYKRREFGIRAAIFFSFAAVSGAFGGLLAAAISDMDGIGGRTGWEWIFILEGLATVLLAVVSPLFLVNFPDQATFLSPIDRARVRKRLRDDLQSSAEYEGFKMKYFWEAMTDWKTYAGAIVYMGADGALYAFSLFLPSIIKELGFSSVKAQLLSVPPYVAAAITTILVGWLADRTNQRGIWNIICGIVGAVGFSMLLAAQSPGLSYAGTFLGAMGIYPCIPNTVAWMANNVEGVYKRGISLAVVIGWGNLNGVMSSNIYRQEDAPKYRLGHAVVLGYMVIGLVGGAIVKVLVLHNENRKRKAGKRDHRIEGLSEREIDELHDKRPDFYYTL